jgi:hypothetical protein
MDCVGLKLSSQRRGLSDAKSNPHGRPDSFCHYQACMCEPVVAQPTDTVCSSHAVQSCRAGSTGCAACRNICPPACCAVQSCLHVPGRRPCRHASRRVPDKFTSPVHLSVDPWQSSPWYKDITQAHATSDTGSACTHRSALA